MIKSLLTMLLCLACTVATAQKNIAPNLVLPDTCGAHAIVHINGVTTKPEDAAANLQRLVTGYGNSYKDHALIYRLAYNQERGFPKDLYDAWLQIANTYAGATWDGYYNAVQFGAFANMSATLASTISKKFDDLFGLTKPPTYTDQDLAEIVGKIQELVQYSPGIRIVIVPHSQGNRYARLAIPKLAAWLPLTSIGVVGVAVPDSGVPNGGVAVTSTMDLVIDSVRAAMRLCPTCAPILGANVTVPYTSADPWGHDFIDVYMANSSARAMIRNGITNQFNKLKTTTKLGSANTGTSKFHGVASYADCTGIAPYGDMSKWPNVWPPARDPNTCGSGTSYPQHAYYVPMVFYYVAGQLTYPQVTARPGEAAEVPNLATIQRDTCIVQAQGYWSTLKAGGTVTGTSGNCGSNYNIELAARYKALIGGDGQTSWTETWTAASIGIGWPYVEGGTDVYTGPTCRN